jgi:hypothetical protein
MAADLPEGFTLDEEDHGLPAGFTIDEPDQPSVGRRATRGLGLGVRDVLEGATALPGMALDALSYPRRLMERAVFGEASPTFTEGTRQRLDATGLPAPESSTERLVSAGVQGAASALPTMGVGAGLAGAGRLPMVANALMGSPGGQIVGGLAGGAAGEGAQQSGFGPAVQAGASLVGGIAGAAAPGTLMAAGRGVGGALAPFREAGRENMVADVLLRSSSVPGTLRNRLLMGAENERLPGAPVTTAVQARDPGLMVMEQGLRSQAQGTGTAAGVSPAARFRDVEARRNAVRTDALDAMGDGSTPEIRGAETRRLLGDQRDEVREMTGAAYESVDPEGLARFPVDRIETTLRGSMDRLYGPGTGGPPPQLRAVLDDLPQPTPRTVYDVNGARREVLDPPEIDWRHLQNLRSRLGAIAGEAAANGDRKLASAAGSAWDEIETTARAAAPADMVDRWDTAAAFRRQEGNLYSRDTTGAAGVGQVLRRDAYGNPTMLDSSVTDRLLRSPADLRQALQAAGSDAPALRRQLQGQFVEQLRGRATTTGVVADAAGNTSQLLSPAGFQSFLEKNRGLIADLFEPGQVTQLRRLAADFAETSLANTAGKARGSDTAQNLSVANVIARASNGLIDPGNPLMQTLAGLGPVMRLIYAAPEAAVREMLTEAMVNPTFAADLLSRASPQAMERAMGYVQSTMGDRLRQATLEATTREAVREGGTSARRRQDTHATRRNALLEGVPMTGAPSQRNRLAPN